ALVGEQPLALQDQQIGEGPDRGDRQADASERRPARIDALKPQPPPQLGAQHEEPDHQRQRDPQQLGRDVDVRGDVDLLLLGQREQQQWIAHWPASSFFLPPKSSRLSQLLRLFSSSISRRRDRLSSARCSSSVSGQPRRCFISEVMTSGLQVWVSSSSRRSLRLRGSEGTPAAASSSGGGMSVLNLKTRTSLGSCPSLLKAQSRQ